MQSFDYKNSSYLSAMINIFFYANGNFGDVNDGKCTLFIRTSVSGGIISMSQMSRNLIYRRRERSRSGEVCQPSLLFSLLSSR